MLAARRPPPPPNSTQGGDDWEVKIQGPDESEIPVKLEDHDDGTYSVTYKLESDASAEGPQKYIISMMLNEDHVPGSPFEQTM